MVPCDRHRCVIAKRPAFSSQLLVGLGGRYPPSLLVLYKAPFQGRRPPNTRRKCALGGVNHQKDPGWVVVCAFAVVINQRHYFSRRVYYNYYIVHCLAETALTERAWHRKLRRRGKCQWPCCNRICMSSAGSGVSLCCVVGCLLSPACELYAVELRCVLQGSEVEGVCAVPSLRVPHSPQPCPDEHCPLTA